MLWLALCSPPFLSLLWSTDFDYVCGFLTRRFQQTKSTFNAYHKIPNQTGLWVTVRPSQSILITIFLTYIRCVWQRHKVMRLMMNAYTLCVLLQNAFNSALNIYALVCVCAHESVWLSAAHLDWLATSMLGWLPETF